MESSRCLCVAHLAAHTDAIHRPPLTSAHRWDCMPHVAVMIDVHGAYGE